MDGKYLGGRDFLTVCSEMKLQTVPVLASDVLLDDWLGGATLAEKSNGKTVVAESASDKLREGVVLRPMEEAKAPKIGRLILKQRSPEFLAKTDF